MFFVVFTIAITISYKKDLKKLKGSYKGIRWVIIGFLSFVFLLVVLKKLSVS
jgi:zinc transporter ZupT